MDTGGGLVHSRNRCQFKNTCILYTEGIKISAFSSFPNPPILGVLKVTQHCKKGLFLQLCFSWLQHEAEYCDAERRLICILRLQQSPRFFKNLLTQISSKALFW